MIWLVHLGSAYYRLGQVEKAIEHHEQALVISREIGDRKGEGSDLSNLGIAYRNLRILAFLTDPPVVTAILLHLELPHEPPLISPARGPPQGDFLDPTPAFDPTDAELIPDFVFDQSLPDELDT